MSKKRPNIEDALERFTKYLLYKQRENLILMMHLHQNKVFECHQNPITTIYRNKYHEVIVDNRANVDGTYGLSQHLWEGNQSKIGDATPAEVYMTINDLFFS
jgi:hypothetical protein